ncbi:hypothetical protein ACLOJK_005655 [Asimina triloba]
MVALGNYRLGEEEIIRAGSFARAEQFESTSVRGAKLAVHDLSRAAPPMVFFLLVEIRARALKEKKSVGEAGDRFIRWHARRWAPPDKPSPELRRWSNLAICYSRLQTPSLEIKRFSRPPCVRLADRGRRNHSHLGLRGRETERGGERERGKKKKKKLIFRSSSSQI